MGFAATGEEEIADVVFDVAVDHRAFEHEAFLFGGMHMARDDRARLQAPQRGLRTGLDVVLAEGLQTHAGQQRPPRALVGAGA